MIHCNFNKYLLTEHGWICGTFLNEKLMHSHTSKEGARTFGITPVSLFCWEWSVEFLKHAVLLWTSSLLVNALVSWCCSLEASKQRKDCGWELQLSHNCVRTLPVGGEERWADDFRQPYDLLLRENGLVTRRLLAHALFTLCPWAKAINLDSSSKYPAAETERDVEEW